MIIKPYSDIAAEAFNASDFPALKHFWDFEEEVTASASIITDKVAGVILPVTSITAGGVSYTNKINSGILTPSSGTLVDFSTAGTSTLIVVIGKLATAAGISFGGINMSTGPRASLYSSVTASTVVDAVPTTVVAPAALTLGATQGAIALGLETGGYVRAYNASTTSLTAQTNDSVALVSALAGSRYSIPQTIYNSTLNNNFGGILIFQFASSTLPANVDDALAWMAYQFSVGVKAVYPGFKGLE